MAKVMTEHMFNMHKIEDSFYKETQYKNSILALLSDKELKEKYVSIDNKTGFLRWKLSIWLVFFSSGQSIFFWLVSSITLSSLLWKF